MSTTDTKLDSLCENLEGCKLDVERKISDEELFKQPPPPNGDCPICFLRIPTLGSGSTYKSCCGQIICSGCHYAPIYDNQGNKVKKKKCAFCRIPTPTSDEEMIERLKKRVEAGDANAMHGMGVCYRDGAYDFPQDHTKALELWHRAVELGFLAGFASIGSAYYNGRGVEIDKKKADHYYKVAAIGGDVHARFNLGNSEWRAGNWDRAMKHYTIATRSGYAESLKWIKEMYLKGRATKDDYTKALQLYQEYLSEIKSIQRDKAAAFNSEKFQYY